MCTKQLPPISCHKEEYYITLFVVNTNTKMVTQQTLQNCKLSSQSAVITLRRVN